MASFVLRKYTATRGWSLSVPVLGTAFVLGLLWTCLAPRWLTNDDVSMSMVAHGYGVAEPGSPPYLMFSNILWGYLVRSIPVFHGVPGYSLATLAVLYASCAATLYGLQRLGVNIWLRVALVLLVWCRPLLFPQFTQNAGLITVAAVILLIVHLREGGLCCLSVSIFFAGLGFLIRSHEFFFVLLVAMPLLPWRALPRSRAARWSILSLSVMLAAAAYVDSLAYQRPEWRAFNELNPVRARFTDFRANQTLLQEPDTLARHGYTPNDLLLIQYWFFADPALADPVRLGAALADAPPAWQQGHSFMNALEGFKTFTVPALFPLLLAGVLGLALRPDRRLFASWGLFVAAIALLGFLGRPGIVHVYLPVAGWLALAPWLTNARAPSRPFGTVLAVLIGMVTSANAALAIADAKAIRISDERARTQMSGLPRTFAVWGDSFPFEAGYPVLGASATAMSYRIYGLGVSTLAPFSVAAAEQQAGRGFIQRLLSEDGLPLIAVELLIPTLERYCEEHHSGRLLMLDQRHDKALGLAHYRCERTEAPSVDARTTG